MRIDVQAPYSISEPLQELIEEKIKKLLVFYDRIQSAKVFLRDEIHRTNHKETRKVEIELALPGSTLYADAAAENFEKAVSNAAEKMRRQIRKLKTQQNDLH